MASQSARRRSLLAVMLVVVAATAASAGAPAGLNPPGSGPWPQAPSGVAPLITVPVGGLEELATLFRKGRHDAVIAKATAVIGSSVGERKDLLYLRGCSFFRIAWFGAAEADLAPLGDYTLGPGWDPASETVRKIAEMREIAPPHVHEITLGRTVLFRVYHDEDDEWTRALVALLPEARRQVESYWGIRNGPVENAVFIFQDRARFDAFLAARSGGRRISESSSATGSEGILIFFERPPSDPAYMRVGSDRFRSVLLHEYTHSVQRRILGYALVPVWLQEGTAQVCGALAAPANVTQNDKAVLRIAAEGGWLPLEDLVEYDRFHAERTERVAYIQGFAMTRYLIGQVGPAKVTQLLNLLAEEGDADAAFRKVLGVSQEEFYEKWRNGPS